MKTPALLILLSLLPFGDCLADIGTTRPLPVVFDEAQVIVSGLIDGSAISSCGDDPRTGVYTMRVTQVMKGKLLDPKSVKICGRAPILLSRDYIVAGKILPSGEVVFEPDAVIQFVPLTRYFRLVSYDSPLVEAGRETYFSVGVEVTDFIKIFGKSLGLESRATEGTK